MDVMEKKLKDKTICQGHGENLDTLKEVFRNGHAALVGCRRKSDGVVVAMLCAVVRNGSEYGITPFAEMVNGNPFELYDPPALGGGFEA